MSAYPISDIKSPLTQAVPIEDKAIGTLPDELKLHILSFLGQPDLKSMALVSRAWNFLRNEAQEEQYIKQALQIAWEPKITPDIAPLKRLMHKLYTIWTTDRTKGEEILNKILQLTTCQRSPNRSVVIKALIASWKENQASKNTKDALEDVFSFICSSQYCSQGLKLHLLTQTGIFDSKKFEFYTSLIGTPPFLQGSPISPENLITVDAMKLNEVDTAIERQLLVHRDHQFKVGELVAIDTAAYLPGGRKGLYYGKVKAIHPTLDPSGCSYTICTHFSEIIKNDVGTVTRKGGMIGKIPQSIKHQLPALN